ncbi:MAG: diadenylate cyclase CdaA [Defluviitaleaceae bacterium]|nr:diadenylate cyclase CdaA [Defluviitaleaceae bacterium]MCL2240151.1 diadenylate cyclase CdaA [Defluviitaleaceae bacterium]
MSDAITRWLVEYTHLPPITIPHIGPLEVIDILIVAFVLYMILRWIRRTHAWVLLRGIIFIVVLAIVANVFSLYALMWLVQNAYAMGLVVIVILFQPELRKALEQIGRGKYFSTFKGETEHRSYAGYNTVDEIIKAVQTLAKTSTGALIVLEQDIDLRDYEREGIPLDAQVSAQLLLNIFERNTPLHDGAVIIRGDRVAAASCILPLTAEHLDSELGTRHRAAIGISEASDARVVVVSEETGQISVALAGEMTRNVNEVGIREMLTWGRPTRQRFNLFRRKGK